MRISALRWLPFRLPFAGAFNTARGAMAPREGLLIFIETDEGPVGLGEATPLASFGGGTLPDMQKLLPEVAAALLGNTVSKTYPVFDKLVKLLGGTALQCGLNTASLDILAQAESQSLAKHLNPAARDFVPVNATIGATGLTETLESVQKVVKQGFGTVKLKLGVSPSIEQEVERIAAVREVIGPDVKLRLDANGAWQVKQAVKTLQALEPYGIELVEQPVAADDIDGLARVRREVNIPVAADEAVANPDSVTVLLEKQAVDILVLKPQMLGGVTRSIDIARQAAENYGVKSFVTTSIDGGVATAAALHLAAALPEIACACGLSTLPLLEASLINEELEIKDGEMKVPQGAGLGVIVNQEQLNRYVCGPAERVAK